MGVHCHPDDPIQKYALPYYPSSVGTVSQGVHRRAAGRARGRTQAQPGTAPEEAKQILQVIVANQTEDLRPGRADRELGDLAEGDSDAGAGVLRREDRATEGHDQRELPEDRGEVGAEGEVAG